jgi:hypothetical protein
MDRGFNEEGMKILCAVFIFYENPFMINFYIVKKTKECAYDG